MLKHSSQYRKAVSSEATPKIPLTFACNVVVYVMGDNFMEMGGEARGGGGGWEGSTEFLKSNLFLSLP